MWRALPILVLAGCELRYGSYLTIDGDANQIRFDRVDLYFGAQTGATSFGSPKGTQRGRVFARQFDPSDRFEVARNPDGSKATEATFYLPATGPNRELGDYVAAVAYRDDMPVGIAERIQFAIERDVVFKYDLELEPFAAKDVALWGASPGCLAYKRTREGDPPEDVFAVVHPDDFDCDDLVAMLDCDDLCTAGTRDCDRGRALCADGRDTCSLGCVRSDGTCQPTTCLPPEVCSSYCQSMAGADVGARLDCATSVDTTPHVEIRVGLDPGQAMPDRPCATSFMFQPPGGHPCKAPVIEHVFNPFDDYAFAVSEAGTSCTLTMSSPTNAAFLGRPHVVVSFEGSPGGPRYSLVVGVQARSDQCAPIPYNVDHSGEVGDCQ